MKTDIMLQIQKDYEAATERYEVFGAFLYGSQNFETDTENSDIDVLILVLPNLQDLINEHKVNTCYQRTNGQVVIKDIRLFMNYLFKSHYNWFQILYTDYKIINPRYSNFENIFDIREELVYANPIAVLNCLLGQLLSLGSKTFTPSDETQARFDKYGYNNKHFANVIYFYDAIKSYIRHMPFKSVLIPTSKLIIKDIKTNSQFDKDAVKLIIEDLSTKAKALINEYKDNTNKMNIIRNQLEEQLYKMLKLNLEQSLLSKRK